MAYSELIKSVKNIKNYMRDFYIYGFKNRDEYDKKSVRSYDNQRRRMESWLGSYLSFRQDGAGKQVFISVDSRNIPQNPLYQVFKAKSFTRGDLILHFYILDSLVGDRALSAHNILDELTEGYLSHFQSDFAPDESTVRKKLGEYVELGLLTREKQGRELLYRRRDCGVDRESWREAVAFFSEAAPLGVVGSYILDEYGEKPSCFGMKHHYMLHALDSDILATALDGIAQKRVVALTVRSFYAGAVAVKKGIPLKIFSSTQTGRQYLLLYSSRYHRFLFYRLDVIQAVTMGEIAVPPPDLEEKTAAFMARLWGVSTGGTGGLERLEMTLYIGENEDYILQRLFREKRHGSVARLDETHYLFSAQVYDAMEMMPWIRSFIGRIQSLACSDSAVERTFYEDLDRMEALYGGDDHGIS